MPAAANDGGEERATRRFQCVAILRYMVATVVTVLAIVVIVKVITVAVRPEDISLSVVQGHVGTTALWKEVVSLTAPTVQRGRIGDGGRVVVGGGDCGDDGGDCPGGGDNDRSPTSTTTYQPVNELDLEFYMSVDNPSGRGDVHCDNVSVTFLDDTGPTRIAGFTLPYGFQVRRQSSHKFYRHVYIKNSTVLAHIASAYGGRTRFTGKLQVTMNTSDTRLGRAADPRTVSFDCWPVKFSVADASDTATSLPCNPS